MVTLSIDENYDINDSACYRIRRLEENLYKGYLPKDYNAEDVITYQWHQNHEYNMQGHFNFYYNITKDSVSRRSMFLYMLLLMVIAIVGEFLANILWDLIVG